MCKTRQRLTEFNQKQIAEILGPDNMYFASLALGRPATRQEAAAHYVANGGPENFRLRWLKTTIPTTR